LIYLTISAYIATAWCILTYIQLARGAWPLKPNLWANAVGGIPILIGNIAVGYWPAVILEIFFTSAGWLGLWHFRRKNDD